MEKKSRKREGKSTRGSPGGGFGGPRDSLTPLCPPSVTCSTCMWGSGPGAASGMRLRTLRGTTTSCTGWSSTSPSSSSSSSSCWPSSRVGHRPGEGALGGFGGHYHHPGWVIGLGRGLGGHHHPPHHHRGWALPGGDPGGPKRVPGGSHPSDPPSFLCPPGLIIDAFGELRDQQEQVKEDMEVSLGVRGGGTGG